MKEILKVAWARYSRFKYSDPLGVGCVYKAKARQLIKSYFRGRVYT